MISAAANYHYSLSHLTKGQNENSQLLFQCYGQKKRGKPEMRFQTPDAEHFLFFPLILVFTIAANGDCRRAKVREARSWLQGDQQC